MGSNSKFKVHNRFGNNRFKMMTQVFLLAATTAVALASGKSKPWTDVTQSKPGAVEWGMNIRHGYIYIKSFSKDADTARDLTGWYLEGTHRFLGPAHQGEIFVRGKSVGWYDADTPQIYFRAYDHDHPDVPHGWIKDVVKPGEFKSLGPKDVGKTYYCNEKTGKTVWRKPRWFANSKNVSPWKLIKPDGTTADIEKGPVSLTYYMKCSKGCALSGKEKTMRAGAWCPQCEKRNDLNGTWYVDAGKIVPNTFYPRTDKGSFSVQSPTDLYRARALQKTLAVFASETSCMDVERWSGLSFEEVEIAIKELEADYKA